MLNSATMNGSEGLGHGTQIMLDGAFADPALLANADDVRTLLERIVAEVEPATAGAAAPPVTFQGGTTDGVSAALVRGETAAMLHTFPALRTVTLHLFSAHDLPLSATTRLFLAAFEVGRFQSSVRAYGHYPPRDPQRLALALAGQRDYVRLRLTPSPAVTT